LNLANNDISHVNPNSFLHLPSLTSLNMGNNSLTEIPDNTFQILKFVTILDLSQNNISSVVNVFNGMESVEVIDLTGNELTSLGDLEESIASLDSLREVKVDDNPFSEELECDCAVMFWCTTCQTTTEAVTLAPSPMTLFPFTSTPPAYISTVDPGLPGTTIPGDILSSTTVFITKLSTESPAVDPSSTSSLLESTTSMVGSSVTTAPFIDSSPTSPIIQPQTTSPVVESSTTSPIIQPQTTSPVVESSTTYSIVESSTTSSVVKSSTTPSNVEPSTTSPLVETSTTSPVVESSTTSPPVDSSTNSLISTSPILESSTTSPIVDSSTYSPPSIAPGFTTIPSVDITTTTPIDADVASSTQDTLRQWMGLIIGGSVAFVFIIVVIITIACITGRKKAISPDVTLIPGSYHRLGSYAGLNRSEENLTGDPYNVYYIPTGKKGGTDTFQWRRHSEGLPAYEEKRVSQEYFPYS